MYLFFDVETNGLHGEAFAIGFVVTDSEGIVFREGIYNAPLESANNSEGLLIPDPWVQKNVVPHLPKPNLNYPRTVRLNFHVSLSAVKGTAAESGEPLHLAADVCYPCETNFLNALAVEHGVQVYPLLDVSNILFAKGYDPVGTYKREPNELPAHNPLNDARQSARIFFAAMRGEPLETV